MANNTARRNRRPKPQNPLKPRASSRAGGLPPPGARFPKDDADRNFTGRDLLLFMMVAGLIDERLNPIIRMTVDGVELVFDDNSVAALGAGLSLTWRGPRHLKPMVQNAINGALVITTVNGIPMTTDQVEALFEE